MSTLSLIQAVEASYTTVGVDLHDCDPSYVEGTIFEVWVTPTQAHWEAWGDYVTWLNTVPEQRQAEVRKIKDTDERAARSLEVAEQSNLEMYERLDAWMAETWRNLSLEETTAARKHLQATNPAAWEWLYNETLRVMGEYRENLVKN